jgi:hypothetical protein
VPTGCETLSEKFERIEMSVVDKEIAVVRTGGHLRRRSTSSISK